MMHRRLRGGTPIKRDKQRGRHIQTKEESKRAAALRRNTMGINRMTKQRNWRRIKERTNGSEGPRRSEDLEEMRLGE